MSSAAEAIMSATTPPPRPAAAKAVAPTADTPSFDDHLAAVTPPEAASSQTSEAETPTEVQAKPIKTTDSADSKERESAPPAPETPAILPTPIVETPTAPMMVQLIAQADGEQPADSVAPAQAAPTNAASPTSDGDQVAAAEGFDKALGKAVAPQTIPTQGANTTPAQQTSLPLIETPALASEADATAPPINTPINTTPRIVQPPVPTPPTKPAGKTVTNEASPTEADAAAPDVIGEAPATTTRPSAETQRAEHTIATKPAPAPKNDDASVQDKLATAIDNAAAQAKTNVERATPPPAVAADVVATKISTTEITLPSVGAIAATSTATAVAPQVATIEHAAARTAPAGAQVAQEIVRRFDGETTKFEMRLDPPELGRVEVRMEVTRDHKVTAVLAADSPQALTELVRHARELEQTLQAAGLELSENGLSFDLRQGGDDASQARTEDGSNFAANDTEPEDSAPVARPIGFERWRGVRIDVMA